MGVGEDLVQGAVQRGGVRDVSWSWSVGCEVFDVGVESSNTHLLGPHWVVPTYSLFGGPHNTKHDSQPH